MNIFGLLGAIGLSIATGFTPSVKKNAVTINQFDTYTEIEDTFNVFKDNNFKSYFSNIAQDYVQNNVAPRYYFCQINYWYDQDGVTTIEHDTGTNASIPFAVTSFADYPAPFVYGYSTCLYPYFSGTGTNTSFVGLRIKRSYVMGTDFNRIGNFEYTNLIFRFKEHFFDSWSGNYSYFYPLIYQRYANDSDQVSYMIYTYNSIPFNAIESYYMSNYQIFNKYNSSNLENVDANYTDMDFYMYGCDCRFNFNVPLSNYSSIDNLINSLFSSSYMELEFGNLDSVFGRTIADAYQDGYQDGLNANNSDAYNQGYQDGVADSDSDAYNRGYQVGYSTGVANSEYQFTNLFSAIADVPILIIRNMFNFDFFGVNLLGVVLSLFSVFLLLWIFRKLIK